jgi:murein DD-endopeptidase MepM/ murein hydrolase activator NlpD
VTPYVGRRARRDVVVDEQPATPYVGRRAARPTGDAAPVTPVTVTSPAPYVGRRIARPAVDAPVEIPAPAPTPVIERLAQPVVEQLVPPAVEHVVEPVVQPVAASVREPAVAFVKPVAPVALLDDPTPRRPLEWTDWNLFAAESPADTGQLPFALTEAFTGSLPRIEGEPGTDFSFDTTTALPAITAGKRARVADRRPRLRVLPSLPALVGVAALAVAGFGALTAGKADMVRVEAGQLRQAGALTGTSAVATVGDRSVSVSRGGGRASAAESAAKAREAALAKIGKQQAGYSEVLRKNQMQLPVAPGAYHLTAGFGDYGLWAHLHTGLDFAAPTGTPIHAISNGVISSAQYDGAYGNKTVETLEDGTELWYCHQVQFNVSAGQEVHAGDIIGYVGSTGHVTGPHTHIEVRPGGGDPVDPYPWLVAHGLQP